MGHIIAVLAACLAAAQSGVPAAPAHPSNGVLELSATPVLAHDPRPIGQHHEAYVPWGGLVEVKIRNVSRAVVRLTEISSTAEFDVEVFDSRGDAVARTELGKRAAANPEKRFLYFFGVSQIELQPLAELPIKLDLSRLFAIEPGHAYQVTLRRWWGFPKVDEAGEPLARVEIGCSFEVPEAGIRRAE